MTLVPTNESKKTMKKYEELWKKIRDQIRKINKNLEYYDEKYRKIKFTLYDNLLLKKTIECHSSIIVVRSIFQEDSK